MFRLGQKVKEFGDTVVINQKTRKCPDCNKGKALLSPHQRKQKNLFRQIIHCSNCGGIYTLAKWQGEK